MMTRRDPWVNMLRTTMATLAAGVGGADAVTVLPFDHALGLPDAFARRIARNTSTILIEESHLARVIDPAGGSWYVERLTDELAHAGWEFFQEIEGAGGQAAALRSGRSAQDLADTWQARSGEARQATRTRHRRQRVPAPGREAGRSASPRPSRRPAACRGCAATRRTRRCAPAPTPTSRRPAPARGSSSPRSARPPRTPRARTFASNLFQAGGIEPVTEGTFEESGATEACLCSSDALYEEQAAEVAAALRAAGAAQVFLAGRPGQYAGVDAYVFAGCDAVAVLSATLDRMGVS